MVQNILLVALGAIFGGIARFLVTHYTNAATHGFPYGTLIVNVVGCFIVGYVLTWLPDPRHDHWRLLIVTGFCGALTTFSTFAFESMAYWHQGKISQFVINLLLTNTACMFAVLLGVRIHRPH